MAKVRADNKTLADYRSLHTLNEKKGESEHTSGQMHVHRKEEDEEEEEKGVIFRFHILEETVFLQFGF